MTENKVIQFLDSQEVPYTLVQHPKAYTAQEIAASAHIPGRQIAKSVMVKIDGEMAMAVLPAPERVNFDRLKEHTGAGRVELASEAEFKNLFPECEPGAMPPFGNIYGMQVFASESLSGEIEIAFCAGSHTELVRISYQDFSRLAEPEVLAFSWTD